MARRFFVIERTAVRRITGFVAGTQCIILDYGRGLVECPSFLLTQLVDRNGDLPTGDALVAKCRTVLTERITVQEDNA